MKKHFLRGLLAALLLGNHTAFSQTPENRKIAAIVQQEYPELFDLYRHIHANPELAQQEKNTAALMAAELKKAGFAVTENVGGYGVVGIMKNGPGPTIMVRTDMDALPIREQTGAPYASTATQTGATGEQIPLMHACGHDMHMAVWTGVARVLSQMKKNWSGTVVLIAQPAEEIGTGARAMLDDGLFSRFPVPDYALALHVNSSLETGKVGYVPGYSLANIDMIDITVKGKGGHGAMPHSAIDPVVLASRLVMDFQTIVSRVISPMEPAVVTVGSIHGGTTGNTIPTEVKMELAVRSLNDAVQQQIIEHIRKICKGVAESAGLSGNELPSIVINPGGSPSVYNDPQLSERLAAHFTTVIGKENVIRLNPEMYGEDFGRYGKTGVPVPILLYSLGVVPKEKMEEAVREKKPLPSTHSPLFIPETTTAMQTGVLTMSSAVMHLLRTKK